MTTIEQEVGPTIGRVQTDTFCAGCGYNLHTQAVLRDERLGILVCRCPECGRYSAAGQTTTASRVWLNRLATGLLAGWVTFLLVLFALCTLFLGMLAYGHTMEMTRWVAPNYPSNKRSVVMPYKPYRMVREPSDDPDERSNRFWAQAFMAVVAGGLALFTGGLFAVLLWHCKGIGRFTAFVPPLLGCSVAAFAWQNDLMTVRIREWGLAQIGLYLLLELVCVGIGLVIGRPIARGMLRILVPPKPRQHLAFLWTTDGRTLKPT
jgi:hypothetical protein